MKAGTTIVVTGFLVPLPATRSESVFSKILLILNNCKKIMTSFAIIYYIFRKLTLTTIMILSFFHVKIIPKPYVMHNY